MITVGGTLLRPAAAVGRADEVARQAPTNLRPLPNAGVRDEGMSLPSPPAGDSMAVVGEGLGNASSAGRGPSRASEGNAAGDQLAVNFLEELRLAVPTGRKFKEMHLGS